MAQQAGYSKNPLNINPFWEKASAEPPLEWSKWAAIFEIAVFAKDGIEVRNLQGNKPALVEPTEPIYEIEITGETEAQKKNREVRNQKKRTGWENHGMKAREKVVLFNSFRWDEADAKLRSYIFLCLGAEGQSQIQQKRPGLVLHTVKTSEIIPTLKDIFVTTRIVAFERYNFICRKKEKIESLEQFQADLVELASRADFGDRDDEWVRDMFTAHMLNEKIAKEILAQTRSPQDAYEYAIRREKGTEHSSTMKINPFGKQVSTPRQEPVHYINQRGRGNFANNQTIQRGRGNLRGRGYPRGTQNGGGQSRQQRSQFFHALKQCYKYGNQFGQNYLESRPAKEKTCSKCAKRGHFAKFVNQEMLTI